MSSIFSSFGTIDCGLELMAQAWVSLEHSFSVRRKEDELPGVDRAATIRFGPHRDHTKFLQGHPTDILVVGYGHLMRPLGPHVSQPVERMIAAATHPPRVVIETWCPKAQVWMWGPVAKSTISRWDQLGYGTRCKRMSATRYGGAMVHDRLIVVRTAVDLPTWEWAPEEAAAEVVRPMSNLLTPPGLVRTRYEKEESVCCPVPDAHVDPMPAVAGSLIRTERGLRRLQRDEAYRGLGGQSAHER